GMTTSFAGKIRFGLTLFPEATGDACTQDATVPIDVGDGNETAIQTMLDAALSESDPNYPAAGPCQTPIDAAIAQVAGDATLTGDMDHAGYAVLITDGKQSKCDAFGGDDGTLAQIQALAAEGIDTFVVGFGDAVDAAELDLWANAGGVPATGGQHAYYDASDQASLDAVLQTIATKTLSCTFELGSAPPDPSKVYVFFDGTEVPRDPGHMDGWDYDGASDTVTLYGAACQELKDGDVVKTEIVYGCDQPPPH
ncbi:MAG TPA: vWA domain-containing protein, partial [Minicystis sp.]|nr:vWA domain-containing protein [Minicystis sp.]